MLVRLMSLCPVDSFSLGIRSIGIMSVGNMCGYGESLADHPVNIDGGMEDMK